MPYIFFLHVLTAVLAPETHNDTNKQECWWNTSMSESSNKAMNTKGLFISSLFESQVTDLVPLVEGWIKLYN